MSDEQHRDDEIEGDVSAVGVNDEPAEDDDVEGHFMRTSHVRMEAPRET